jgi:hypothetical protein
MAAVFSENGRRVDIRSKTAFGFLVRKSSMILLFLVFSVNPVFAAEARSEPEAKYVIKWGTILPTQGALGEKLLKIKKMIEEQTGGGIKISGTPGELWGMNRICSSRFGSVTSRYCS